MTDADENAEQISLFGQKEQAAGSHPAAEEPAAGDGILDVNDLSALGRIARQCQRCELRAGCSQVVFGEGDPQADLMLVGEGPGAREDELGRPFVGRAGQLLDKILAACRLQRDEVYITNTVLCRPPGNRTPRRSEINTCFSYLRRQIELVKPKVIMALGATATRTLIDPKASVTRLRGTWHEFTGIPLMPTFHPAALLRDPRKKKDVWSDFQAVCEHLGLETMVD